MTGCSPPSQGNLTENDAPWLSVTSSRRSRIGNSSNWRAPRRWCETSLPIPTTGRRSFACKTFSCCIVRIDVHFYRSVASSVLRICYGHEITHPGDPLLKIAQDALESPRDGPYLVDLFPLCASFAPSPIISKRFCSEVLSELVARWWVQKGRARGQSDKSATPLHTV